MTMMRTAKKHQRPSLIPRPLLDISALVVVGLFPSVAFAATASFKEVVSRIIGVFNGTVVPALIGIGVFLIIFGIFRYISAGDDPKKLAEGGKLILWGVIAVFVMLSVWGLVSLVLNTVFTSQDRASFNLSSQLWDVSN